MSDLNKQAVKCVNEFVERADGNWKGARKLWLVEVGEVMKEHGPEWGPTGWTPWCYAMEAAFDAMQPEASDKQ